MKRTHCLPGPLDLNILDEPSVPEEVERGMHVSGSIYQEQTLPSNCKDIICAVDNAPSQRITITPLPRKFIHMLKFLSVSAVRIRIREEGIQEASLDHYLATTKAAQQACTEVDDCPSIASTTIHEDTTYFLRNVFSVHSPKMVRDRKYSNSSDRSEQSTKIGRIARGRSSSASSTLNPAVAHHVMNSCSRNSAFSKYNSLRQMLPKSDLFALMEQEGISTESINNFLSQE